VLRLSLPPVLLGSAFALAAALFGQAPSAAPQQPKPVAPSAKEQGGFRAEVRLVNVVATVTDKHNHFVTDLGKQDFRILEDGHPQEISFFARQTDLPLRIGLLLDTSNSIRQRLDFEKEAATDFFYNVMRRKKDLAFVVTFDNEPEVVQDFTEDPETLKNAVQRQRAGGGTALYDAVYSVCLDRLMTPPLPSGGNPDVRRLLVVISDGEDTLSDHTRTEAVEMAQRAGVALYNISTSTDWLAISGDKPQKIHKTPGDEVLAQFAEETGGRVYFPYRADDLAQSFQDIGTELRNQYLLAYTPANRVADGKFRRIRVEVDRKNLIVRTRKGYYALPGPTPARPAAAPGS
jgi:VWFA-related protein